MATEQQYDIECKGDGLSIFTPEQQIDIRCSGSEVFHQEWEGSMDLCFSSPPYFNLEDYKIGNQSWKPGMSYRQWVDSYLRPTIRNCYRYLKAGGKFVCNIKNFNGLDLEGDVCNIASSFGMQYEGIDKLEQGNRILCTAKLGDSSEKCFVFVK
jgi:tRNA1(Val) A37 N6-methylase TrmN6